MGAVLSFVPRPADTRNAKPLNAGAAAVIIFPGVRYERPRSSKSSVQNADGGNSTEKKNPGPARH